jgi:hypothetical protein
MTQKQKIETLEAKFDKLLEIVGNMNNDKITETKKVVKKVTKTRKIASNTQTLDHITSLVKVVNKANGKEFSNEFVTQVPYASLSKFVDVFTQVTTNKDGEAVEKILIKQGFNSFKKSPDRIALTDDEAISLVGVMVKKYPQIREAIIAL